VSVLYSLSLDKKARTRALVDFITNNSINWSQIKKHLRGDRSLKYDTSISDYEPVVKRYTGTNEKRPGYCRVKCRTTNYLSKFFFGFFFKFVIIKILFFRFFL
jgi:hypothetical protein